MSIRELKPIYDSKKSFYGKAHVKDNKLYSYGTLVAEIKNGKPVIYGKYSRTTTRHQKEFLKQNGFKADRLEDYYEKTTI